MSNEEGPKVQYIAVRIECSTCKGTRKISKPIGAYGQTIEISCQSCDWRGTQEHAMAIDEFRALIIGENATQPAPAGAEANKRRGISKV
jgi:hypothetical protein